MQLRTDATTVLIFDGRQNVIQSIDPLGFTNRFIYDSQNNLLASVDARGNSNVSVTPSLQLPTSFE